MESSRFDAMTRLIGRGRTRRNVLETAMVSAAGLGVVVLGLPELAEARKRKKGNKKKRCKKAGAACSSDKQCCTDKTNRICDVPHGASNSDTACCGGEGVTCGGVDGEGNALGPFCCVGEAGVREFVCSQNDPNNPNVPGTCIPYVEEP